MKKERQISAVYTNEERERLRSEGMGRGLYNGREEVLYNRCPYCNSDNEVDDERMICGNCHWEFIPTFSPGGVTQGEICLNKNKKKQQQS